MININPDNHTGDCFAYTDREIILKADVSFLDFNDLVELRNNIQCHDIIVEPEYAICAMGISKGETIPPGYTTETIRLFNDKRPEDTVLRIQRGKALVEWVKDNAYCPRCGKKMTFHTQMTAMQCPDCHNLVFPRINPCIIVLVHRGKEILLARHVQRNQDVYACIAGFMEVGETAEQAVAREVFEETGIRIRNIRYMGSQSWPFPAQLMLAFYADYESGEIKVQEDEIQDAAWFHQDHCPATPPPGSIAYRLIHHEF